MEPLITVVGTLLTAVPIGIGAAWFVGRGSNHMAAAFLPPQSDLGWPHGVQEEDGVKWAVENLHPPGTPPEELPEVTIEVMPLAEGIEGELLEGARVPAPTSPVRRH